LVQVSNLNQQLGESRNLVNAVAGCSPELRKLSHPQVQHPGGLLAGINKNSISS